MDEFGDAGYSVFFITLEIYGQEFNHLDSEGWLTVSRTFLGRKLRKSSAKVEQILNFYSERQRIGCKISGTKISINCPKYVEIVSNWVNRRIKSPTEGPTEGPTAIEEKKKRRRIEKNKNKDTKNIYGTQFKKVMLFEIEYQKLIETFGQDKTKEMIENMDIYLQSKGDKYKDHYATLLLWERKNKGGNNGSGTGADRTGPKEIVRPTSAARNLGDGNSYPVDLEVTE